MTLDNRVVVSPMDMYSAEDGTPNDFHLVHLGARALGGAGLVMTEMTCVSPEARITLGCTGMYTAGARGGLAARSSDFVHQLEPREDLPAARPLGPQGLDPAACGKGTNEPLEPDGWEVMAASPIPFSHGMQAPREMTRADMDRVRDEFVRAARDGDRGGLRHARAALRARLSALELHHAARNQRTDEYGGSLENRLRFPLEVFRAMRAAWPAGAADVGAHLGHRLGGGRDRAEPKRWRSRRRSIRPGADIIHVSAGQTSPDAKPVYGRMFQTPFSATASATRRGCPRSPSATSPRRTR